MTQSDTDLEQAKVNLETSLIAWSELQRFFAQGLTLFISAELDLVEMASHFSADNKALIEPLINANQIHTVSDQQALQWIESDAEVWAVVVKPWILVQDKS